MKITFKYITLSLLAGASLLTSCEDFLDREPLDSVTPDTYLKNESQLAAYAINAYSFNIHSGYNGSPIVSDNGTDNQATASPNTTYWEPGQWRVGTYDAWGFGTIRNLNYFLEIVIPRWEAGEIEGVEKNIKQYIGEIYFLRAWEYFSKLQNLGDFPILTKVLSDKKEDLIEASKRRPRNEVARFILSDLDKAAELMTNSPVGGKNRLTRNAALLVKSRVALSEATWLKYHRGTGRVPGDDTWPGKQKDYLKDFTINVNQEIDFFLTEAMAAAKEVGDQITLTVNSKEVNPTSSASGWNPFFEMYNSKNLEDLSEVVFWKAYDKALSVNHNATYYTSRGGGNYGFTKGYVKTFLMENGLPWYASNSQYQGDDHIYKEFQNRDYRLRLFSASELDRLQMKQEPVESDPTTWNVPKILELPEGRNVTGYHIRKAMSYEIAQGSGGDTHFLSDYGCVVFRGVEAMLNYMEACYEKNSNLDATAESYWKAIRTRAGVDPDFNKTIAATDYTKEDDWAIYSAGQPVDKTLYNIRRERRCEFIADGMRMWDLKRWRALDQVKNYVIEGFNLWGGGAAELYKDDKGESRLITTGDQANVSSQAASGNNLCPYRMTEKNNTMYNGYTWTPACYLYPIVFSDFMLSSPDGDVNNSPIYQNPGWPIEDGASALELPN